MKVLCILVSVLVAVNGGYHEQVGIPLAARIKAYEDRIFAKGRDINYRVVGGDIAPVFAHPYMAGLLLKLDSQTVSMCASSLVTHTRLVTAAHCLTGLESIKAVLETPFLYHGGTRITTRDYIAHPSFDENVSADCDIGVVKIPYVNFTEILHPIRLPSGPNDAEKVGEWAVVAGWGITTDANRGYKPDEENLLAHEVDVQIAPEQVCMQTYHTYTYSDNTVCTSGRGGVGACDGDSGGPLVVQRKRSRVLVGVVSHAYVVCEASKPTVFTRVLTYKNFILGA